MKKFKATYNLGTNQGCRYNPYNWNQKIINSLLDFTEFWKECGFDFYEDRIKDCYNSIVNKTVYGFKEKNKGFVDVGGSFNPYIQFDFTDKLESYYVITEKDNIVAMINNVETYINPRTKKFNPVEKPCFRGLSNICRINRIYGGVNEIIADFERIEREIKEREQQHLKEMYEELRGWYVVTITGSAMKFKGNDGNSTASVKVLASNKMEAYSLACEELSNNPKGNVINWLFFESEKSALIEFVGVWTDESELEFN